MSGIGAKYRKLNAELAKGHLEGPLVKASRRAPVSKYCAHVLFCQSATAILIQERKEDCSNMVTKLLMGDPGGHLPELFHINTNVLTVEEEEGSFKLNATGEHVEQVSKGRKRDPAPLGWPDLLHPLQHRSLLLWGDF